jgi:hypothetical protein
MYQYRLFLKRRPPKKPAGVFRISSSQYSQHVVTGISAEITSAAILVEGTELGTILESVLINLPAPNKSYPDMDPLFRHREEFGMLVPCRMHYCDCIEDLLRRPNFPEIDSGKVKELSS